MSIQIKSAAMVGAMVLASGGAPAQDSPKTGAANPSAAEQTALSDSVEQVAKDCQPKIDERKAAYAARAEQFKHDADDAKPRTSGASRRSLRHDHGQPAHFGSRPGGMLRGASPTFKLAG